MTTIRYMVVSETALTVVRHNIRVPVVLAPAIVVVILIPVIVIKNDLRLIDVTVHTYLRRKQRFP